MSFLFLLLLVILFNSTILIAIQILRLTLFINLFIIIKLYVKVLSKEKTIIQVFLFEKKGRVDKRNIITAKYGYSRPKLLFL